MTQTKNDLRWPGLARAVDVHLHRWSRSDRARLAYDAAVKDRPGKKGLRAADTNRLLRDDELVRTWCLFARSYGVVGEDGIAVRGHTSPDGTPLDPKWPTESIAVEGATAAGRERLGPPNHDDVVQGLTFALREHMMLSAATSHYVSAEVIDEVTEAADCAFPDVLVEDDIFTRAGFAVFETPLPMWDLDPETGQARRDIILPVRAIAWQVQDNILDVPRNETGPGITLWMYSDPVAYAAIYQTRLVELGYDPERDFSGAHPLDLFPVETSPWKFGIEWSERDEAEWEPGTIISSVGWIRRWFYAFMRLCWQQIIVRHPEKVARVETRRWERLAKRKELLDYTVLRLRRHVDPYYTPTGLGTPLDHRVLVREHRRFVYLPSVGGPARLPDGTPNPDNHRWVTIDEHWRGPEDGPIGAMHHTTSVTR